MTAPLLLVTGSSDGIGKETACALAEKGARVILHGRNPERLAIAAKEVDRRSGSWPAGEELADLRSWLISRRSRTCVAWVRDSVTTIRALTGW
jgi:NAD(P)-dependent dehydrogenase (short-subunit alcohol dehydrogenase family)